MTTVIKIGGVALEAPETLKQCVSAIRDLAQSGRQVLVIHGGGAALTRTLRQMGHHSDFVNGLRVTDAATRDAALMVLCGLMNKTLVASLVAAGVHAIGLCGGDGPVVRARKMSGPVDLGYVGEVSEVDARWLHTIWDAGGVPVMASMAPDSEGIYYNINADQMAASCAASCAADELIFLTEVAGVLDAQGQPFPRLHPAAIAQLIDQSVITGGMLPKMAACQKALDSGVHRVRIFPAAQAALLSQLSATLGTEVASR